MPITTGNIAPYAPATGVLEVFNRYRTRGLQTPITKDVLVRAGVSETLVPRTMQALQLLDLIDDEGMPTAAFENIRKAPEAQYKQQMAEWIRATYTEIFNYVDPSTDDEIKIRDAFRSYHPIAQQGRMVALFLNLCEAAGIKGSSGKESKPRMATRRLASGRTATGRMPGRPVPPRSPGRREADTGELPSAIAGLLKSLPPENGTWTQEQHDKFLKTFASVLDFCYQIGAQQVDSDQANE